MNPDISETLRYGAHILEILLPASAYKEERDGHEHRAHKAASTLWRDLGASVTRYGPGMYRVKSGDPDRPNLSYHVDLDHLTCDCPDRARKPAHRDGYEDRASRDFLCYHILQAVLAEGMALLWEDEQQEQQQRASVKQVAA